MKEPTIKKETIDIVRQMVADGQVSQEVAEKYFPELRESEDEKIRQELIAIIQGCDKGCYVTISPTKIEKYTAWLEKQGEQKPIIEMKSAEESLGINSETYSKIMDECIHGEQKPAWSAEDERKIQDCIDAVSHVNLFKVYYQNELVGWLKSLKTRYTWKPSDEQLEALKNAIHIKPFKNPSDSILWRLYEQLKKLKS